MATKSISSFTPDKRQRFILDTNVLIKLLYPAMSGKNTIPYEKLYQQIIEKGSELIISSVQISEFVNRCIRFQYSLWTEDKDENIDFKHDYRNTDDYKNCMMAILEIIQEDILSHSTCINDRFNEMDSKNLYKYGFSYDFNDSLLVEIARLHNAILITDDIDFANYSSNIDIITGNQGLLMFNKK